MFMKRLLRFCVVFLIFTLIIGVFQNTLNFDQTFAQSNSSKISVETNNRASSVYFIYNETLWKWGGTYEEAVKLSDESGWKALSCSDEYDYVQPLIKGSSHVLFLKNDGSLWAMGSNNHGQLGDGSKTDKDKPVRIGKDTDWVYVSASFHKSFAIKKDGSLWSWGESFNAPFKNIRENKSYPQKFGNIKWKEFSAQNLYGITLNGKIAFLWDEAKLPSNKAAWKAVYGYEADKLPSKSQNNNWKTISSSFGYFVIKTDGSLWGLGSNDCGEMGTGSKTNYYKTLQPLKSSIGWAKISKSELRSAGIKSDGSLWFWGDNLYDRFGLNTKSSDILTPTQFGKDKDWADVSINDRFVAAAKKDGSVWVWGELPFFDKTVKKPFNIMDANYANKYQDEQRTMGNSTVTFSFNLGETVLKTDQYIRIYIKSEDYVRQFNYKVYAEKNGKVLPFKAKLPKGNYTASIDVSDKKFNTVLNALQEPTFKIDYLGNCDVDSFVLDFH